MLLISEKEIHYIDESRIIGRTEEIVLDELVYDTSDNKIGSVGFPDLFCLFAVFFVELEERIQTINPILHIHDII